MTWPEAVQKMGKWYEANVHTYAADAKTYKNPPCSLLGGEGVRWDCTGYVASCLQLFGIIPRNYWGSSEDFGDPNSHMGKKLAKGGFKAIQYNGRDGNGLQPYDIVAVFEGRSKGQQHHAEIYAGKENGKNRAWSWGNVHDGRGKHPGMPCPFANYRYKVIYRYDGVARDTPGFVDFSDSGGTGGSGGGGTYIINLDNYIEPYPVHSEYDTYSGTGGNIYEKAENNAFSLAILSSESSTNSSLSKYYAHDTSLTKAKDRRTRIYSTNDAKIVLDELKLPLDTTDSWANKGVTDEDVKKWEKEMEQMREEAKKKAEEERKKAEEAKKLLDSSANSSTNTSTGKNTSTK